MFCKIKISRYSVTFINDTKGLWIYKRICYILNGIYAFIYFSHFSLNFSRNKLGAGGVGEGVKENKYQENPSTP